MSNAWEEFLSVDITKNPPPYSRKLSRRVKRVLLLLRILISKASANITFSRLQVLWHVGYLPSNNRVVGLSKIPRLSRLFREEDCNLQENLGNDIISAINLHLKPKGVGCIIKAKHYCTGHRGIRKPNAIMTTAALSGVFKTQPIVRQEFYEMLKL